MINRAANANIKEITNAVIIRTIEETRKITRIRVVMLTQQAIIQLRTMRTTVARKPKVVVPSKTLRMCKTPSSSSLKDNSRKRRAITTSNKPKMVVNRNTKSNRRERVTSDRMASRTKRRVEIKEESPAKCITRRSRIREGRITISSRKEKLMLMQRQLIIVSKTKRKTTTNQKRLELNQTKHSLLLQRRRQPL